MRFMSIFIRVLLLATAFAAPLVLSAQQGPGRVAARLVDLYAAGTVFEQVDLFSVSARPYYPATNAIRNAQTLTLDRELLSTVFRERPDYIRMSLPYNGATVIIDLYAIALHSDQFTVQTSEGKQAHYTPGLHYRGSISGRADALASISLFEEEVMGLIVDPIHGNRVLGRLELQENRTQYILYDDRQLPIPPDIACQVRTHGGEEDPRGPIGGNENIPGCVEVFLECDHALFLNKGSVLNTINYTTGLFNQVATLYDDEDISVTISQMYIWVTPDNYPTNSSFDALDAFMNLRTNFAGDLAHLLALGGNGLGGVAYLDVLCNNTFNYAYSNIASTYQNVPTYSWSVMVVAHEMGHNFGSNHTHWCGWPGGAIDNCYTPEGNCAPGPPPNNGGTIMSYCHLNVGINFNNGFGPLPGQKLRDETAFAETNSCIVTNCPVSSCNAPSNITVSGITNASATISWGAVSGATSYNLQYRIVGTGTWTTVNNVTSPHTINGLNADTQYEVQLQTICGGGASRYSFGVIFRTAQSACPNPSGLSASNITATSARINWTENGSATEWELQYGLNGFSLGSGTFITTTARPYTINGLSHSLNYQVYVRSLCGGSQGNSAWVGPLSFSTTLSNNQSSSAVEIIVDASCPGTNIYRNNGAGLSSGEYNPLYQSSNSGATGYWGTAANHTVWFYFSAPPSGAVRITTDISPLGSLTDTQLSLYSTTNPSNYSSFVYLSSNEDGGTIGQGFATVLYYCGLEPGTNYYIQVDGWESQVGSFCLEVHEDMAIGQPGNTCTSYSMQLVNGTGNPDKWFNIYTRPNNFDIGLPVAAIRTSQNLGTVTVQKRRYNSVQTSGNGVKYMQRYYNIASSLNSSGNKDVRIFHTQAELDNLKAATGSNETAADLNITHYDGVNENCVPADNNGVHTLITDVDAAYIGPSDIFYLQLTAPGFSEFATHFGLTPLPVELLAFTGTPLPDGNRLQWTVASETDLLAYAVERSETGAGSWVEVGRVEPRPDQFLPKQYGFVDIRRPFQAYYRLRMVDLDGSFAYSRIIRIERDDEGGLLRVAPNPARDKLVVYYRAPGSSEAVVRIADPTGSDRYIQRWSLVRGDNQLEIDLSRLPPGVYALSILPASGAPPQSVRFVKQ
jgi:hypothetical protein